MKEISTQLLVIGGGPGGYVAAIRAGQLGVPTVLAEGAGLGGTCLNIGCIPSKALIHAAHDFEQARLQAAGHSPMGIRVKEPTLDLAQTVRWKDGIVKRLTSGVGVLLRKAGVQVLQGWATVEDGKTAVVQVGDETVRVRCEHLLIATGSEPVALPSMPFGGAIWSSTDALSPAELPRRLVVVGAGYIGLELSFAYRKLGTEVTVVEAAPDILPRYDEALTKPVLDSLKKAGVVLHLGCSVAGYDAKNGVHVRNARADEFALPADKVLVAVGRRPRATGFGIEGLQLTMNGRAIATDAHCATSMRNVWAIGDVTGEPVLAHRAMAQGECVAEQIAGKPRRFEPMAIPAVCFTDPEVVVCGMTTAEAKAAGIESIEASFPFAANGRAMTLGAEGGFVRVLARKSDHVII
ncbi:MAG: dihydrolipoyl dehydrogenase, partial [Burkholderiales bacterium 66-5]